VKVVKTLITSKTKNTKFSPDHPKGEGRLSPVRKGKGSTGVVGRVAESDGLIATTYRRRSFSTMQHPGSPGFSKGSPSMENTMCLLLDFERQAVLAGQVHHD